MSLNRKQLETKLGAVTSKLLRESGYISMTDSFIKLGYLSKEDCEAWRMKKIPYLEKTIKINLGKISFIVKTIRKNCINGKLKPSYTGYKSWGKSRKIQLRFSKTSNPYIEEVYSTHYVKPQKSV